MAITDELREWAKPFHDVWYDYKSDTYTFTTDGDGQPTMDSIRADTYIMRIADRIDEEHEAVVSTACRLAAALNNDALAERGYIALPKDADGVPIHIGDYLHCDETGEDFPCRGYCCSVGKNGERRWTVECSYDAYSGTSEYVSARRCRHYHAPTEDFQWVNDRRMELEGECERLDTENAKLRDLALNCYRMAKAHCTDKDCRTRCSHWPECCEHDSLQHAEPCELAVLACELGIEVDA